MRSGELKHFIEQIKQLPTIPPVGIKIIECAEDGCSSLRDIARLIQSDQSLSAKVLRIANSAQFGFSRQVHTVERATSLLGLDLIRSIALSIIVIDVFKKEQAEALNLVEFWRHSTCCAIACKLLARKFQYPHPEEAFVAGLLHDIGKLVFLYWDREEYEKVILDARALRCRLLENEEIYLGAGHAQIARMLMEYWKFPASLVQAAWLHHQPLAQFDSNPRTQLPFIVKCANSLCHIQRFGDSGNPVGDLDYGQLEKTTGLSPDEISGISAEVLQSFEEVSKYFDWEGCTPDLYLSAMARANQELSRLHLDVLARNRKILSQQSILEAICAYQVSLPAQISPGAALELVLEHLGKAVPHNRLMGFLFAEREGIIEGRIRFRPGDRLQRVTLPLDEDSLLESPQQEEQKKPSLVERAMLQLGEGIALGAEIMQAIQKGKLIVLPLQASGINLGQILIEPTDESRTPEEVMELLHQFTRSVVLALERVFLFEAIQQQAEDLARMARKGQETQTQLYQAERLASVGRLAAGAAHEINNPLAAISAQAQLMLRRAEDEKDRKALQSIIDQTGRISKIISDLMGFARPAEPCIEPAAVKMVIEHALSILEHRTKISGVEIRKEFQPDIPLIYADSKQLEQVFLNLAVNAIHAMDKGGVLTIRVGVDSDKEHLRIDFADTGIGIQPRDIPSIFDPFFTTKREGEGTGLGLAICHSIIESHHGTIKVSSQPGKGSVFTIHLPLEGKSKVRQIQSNLKRKLKTVSGTQQKENGAILIIDDEEALRLVLAESLSHEGYQVDVAIDGVEGLEKLNQQAYDVALLDLRMPRKQGMEVLKTVRKLSPQMPVIVISGLAHENEFKNALDAGAFACFKKPFDIGELIGTIRRAIKTQGAKPDKAGNQIA